MYTYHEFGVRRSKLISAEECATGHVSLQLVKISHPIKVTQQVYKSYVISCGGIIVLLIIFGVYCFNGTGRLSSDFWLSNWSSQNAEER